MDFVDHGNRYAQQMIDHAVANRTRYVGESRRECSECGDLIPEARRQAIPGCQRCTSCEEDHDKCNQR